jgi:hypothetical protein
MRILFVLLFVSLMSLCRCSAEGNQKSKIIATVDANGDSTLHTYVSDTCRQFNYWGCQQQLDGKYVATYTQVCVDADGNLCTGCIHTNIQFPPASCKPIGTHGKCKVSGRSDAQCYVVDPVPAQRCLRENVYTCDATIGIAQGSVVCYRQDGSPCPEDCNPGVALPPKKCDCCGQPAGVCTLLNGAESCTCINMENTQACCHLTHTENVCDVTTGLTVPKETWTNLHGQTCIASQTHHHISTPCQCNGNTCVTKDKSKPCTCSESCDSRVAPYSCNIGGIGTSNVEWVTPTGKVCISGVVTPLDIRSCKCCDGKCNLDSVDAQCDCIGDWNSDVGCPCKSSDVHCECHVDSDTRPMVYGTATVTGDCEPKGCSGCRGEQSGAKCKCRHYDDCYVLNSSPHIKCSRVNH